ncbi:hypothetical protein BD413DRAFT_669305 [Trametes elegans]|nr:hypothetical protein BD413DRAFT_669305 [Trametes elegans]
MSTPGPWRDAAPAPRGAYQYPAPHPAPCPRAPPPQPMAEHPFAGAVRQSYYAPPVPGFYSPALAQPAPALPLGRGSLGLAPAFPRPQLPASLMPGHKPTFSITRSQSDDYFFQGDPSPPHSVHAHHAQTSPMPPIPRKPHISNPPLPPKPSFPPPSVPPFAQGHPARDSRYPSPEKYPLPSAPPLPPPPAADPEDDVYYRVLEMSAKESERQKEEVMISEEAQLAAALQASLQLGSPPCAQESDGRSPVMTASPEQGPSALPYSNQSPVLDISFDSLQKLDAREESARQQILDDEALALQLAQEEERLAEEERRRAANGKPSSPSHLDTSDGLPQYEEAVSSPAATSPATSSPHHLQPIASPSFSSPRNPTLGRSISDKPVPTRTSPVDEKRVSRSQSVGVGETVPTTSAVLSAPALTLHPTRPSSAVSSDLESVDKEREHSSGSELPSNTQYLDAEYLAGLSIGFSTPSITPTLRPFEGVIPNVIALPYGRCPPFHLKAPSWRTLLKLMARLSGTRLEPTMEALAVVKTEMKLRVVVSFVKVHHASSEWHTVLYMTIDHPVPPSAPAGWRYRNGDTNTLPWSYTLSQLPPFLRDGADAALSKFYTIPASHEAPLPTLPISFPNLATYLALALESSRDAMHDSSSGVRRLAKYVDQFYPSDRVGLDDAPERAGMRQRLKNLVGIGSRPQRDRNAEMYELVTPFVPDEHGR